MYLKSMIYVLYWVFKGLVKEILKVRVNLSFNVLDTLNSRRIRSITTGDNFYTSGNFRARKASEGLKDG